MNTFWRSLIHKYELIDREIHHLTYSTDSTFSYGLIYASNLDTERAKEQQTHQFIIIILAPYRAEPIDTDIMNITSYLPPPHHNIKFKSSLSIDLEAIIINIFTQFYIITSSHLFHHRYSQAGLTPVLFHPRNYYYLLLLWLRGVFL